jgi:hypothetical protein
MPRIGELLAEEITRLDASGGAAPGSPRDSAPNQAASGSAAPGSPRDPNQAASAGSGAGSAVGSGSAQDSKQGDAHKQQLDQARQQLTHAEELRGQAQTALAALEKALSGNTDPMPPARDADAKLTELRKLFFSVIEHLQELIREQGETRDQTSAAGGEDDFTRAPKLPGLVDRQEGHAKMAKAITDALAQQADAAGKQPPQAAQGGGPDAKALGAAADEVRQSQTDMGDARATLVKARDAKAATESLAPAAKSQAKAVEHLENALRLLQPPPQKKDQNDKDQQQQQQQQQQKPQQKPDPQQQQGGAGQRARDEDARRQRERRDRDQQSDPVEKDW